MKLLIVDDEVRQVKALSAIIQKLEPHYQISEAFEGETAWHMIQNKTIDAVISDIRMPMMDGLELVERIKSFKPDIKVALISGYSEFEYAHKAIKNDVVNYIVKPISYQNIIDVIQKFKSQLQHDETLRKARLAYEDELWNRLISEQTNPAMMTEIMNMMPSPGHVYLCVTEYHHHDAEIKNTLYDNLSPLGEVISFVDHQFPQRIITLLWLQEDLLLSERKIRDQLMKRFEHHLLIQFPNVKIGISELSHADIDVIPTAYKQAVTAWKHHFYREGDQLIFYQPNHDFKKKAKVAQVNYEHFIQALAAEDRLTLSQKIDRLLHLDDEDVRAGCYMDPHHYKQQIVQFIVIISERLKHLMDQPSWEKMFHHYYEAVLHSDTYSELRFQLKQWVEQWLQHIHTMQHDKNGFIVKRCQKYLNDHYMHDLSLEKVAKKYHFNPSYFSMLFKEKTGISFTEYIQDIRISHAKRLLKETTSKINEISEKVGFRNPAYFIKIFKRQTGFSPNQYRQVVRREQL